MNLIRTTPGWLLITLLLAAPVAWGLADRRFGLTDRWRLINKAVLIAWLALVIYGALLTRWEMDLDGLQMSLVPFENLHWYNMKEVYLNIAMFEPIGMTLGVLLKDARASMPRFMVVFLIGLGLSVTIEVLQKLLTLGAFEIDDIIWNTAGALLGTGIKSLTGTNEPGIKS